MLIVFPFKMAIGDLEDTQAVPNYFYLDDTGNIVYPGLDEDDTRFS